MPIVNPHFFYLCVDLGCFLVPFLFSFHPKLRFYLRWKSYVVGALFMSVLFIPWDIFFTAKGIWGFSDAYTMGWKLGGLPLEEWLFFICIPYACLFTYHCFRLLIKTPLSEIWGTGIGWFVVVLNLAVAISYIDRWYTFAAHGLCAFFLILHLLFFKTRYLNWFFMMYVVILIPFLTSNGILTGLDFWSYPFINTSPEFIAEKIVWYNNDHNLGLRFFSMPADDLAYGMLMLLMVVTGYEWAERRSSITTYTEESTHTK